MTINEVLSNDQLPAQLPQNVKHYYGWGDHICEEHTVLRDVNCDEIYVLFTITWEGHRIHTGGETVECNCKDDGWKDIVLIKKYNREEFMAFLDDYCEDSESLTYNIGVLSKAGIL